MPFPAVELQVVCSQCEIFPVVGAFPKEVGRRANRYVVEVRCADCGNVIHFMSHNKYPEFYDSESLKKIRRYIERTDDGIKVLAEPKPKVKKLSTKRSTLTVHEEPAPESVKKSKPVVPKESKASAGALSYMGRTFSFRGGKAYFVAKYLIEKGEATFIEMNAMFGYKASAAQYSIWLSGRGMDGLYEILEDRIVLIKDKTVKEKKRGK